MKSWKLFFLLVVSTLLLVACGNPPTKVETTPPVNVKKTEEKAVTCEMLKEEQSRQGCLQAINNAIADILKNEITRFYDLGRCAELPSFQAEDCKKTIEATGIKGPITKAEATALETATRFNPEKPDDLTPCAQFTTAGLKAYCEKQLQNSIEQEKLAKAMEGKDSAKCDELKNDDEKRICKARFGIIKAPPAPEAPPAQPE